MSLRRSPLGGIHAELDASVTEFGGWEMPLKFDSIRDEHESVREAVGIFDVSHMGQLVVDGPDARTLMGRLTTNDVSNLDVGDSQYAAITDESGVMLDDTIVYRLPDGPADERYLFVPNAGNDERIEERWRRFRDEWGLEAAIENRTDDYGMIAVQGPAAMATVREYADDASAIGSLSRFDARYLDVVGVECWCARTGYTGEDGVELLVEATETERVWRRLLERATPCGLGARDTLRIEAAYLLSGQDFDPETNPRTPYEAGIGFAVKLDTEFVGRDALEAQFEDGPEEKLVGLCLIDRGVPRPGYAVTTPDGEAIGTVTSGTMSPTRSRPIGLAYVPVEHATPGTRLRVDIRGQAKKAKVESIPFIDTV